MKFAKMMAGLSSTTHKKFTADETEFWFKAFSDLPAESVEQGFQRFVLVGDDWPSIAKIRAMAVEQSSGRHITAGEAFKNVATAVRRSGSYHKSEAYAGFNPLTIQVIEQCGGWDWFCELSSDNRTTISAQFERRYNATVERAVETKCLPEPLRPKRIEAEPDELVKRLAERFGK